jgi:hypothetical protein
MGIGSYKEAERYRMRTNKNLTRTFYLDTKRTLDDEPFAWEQSQDAGIMQPEAVQEFSDGGRVGFELGGEVQDWARDTYPEVNFDFKKYPKFGVDVKSENYDKVRKAISKKITNPSYSKTTFDLGINRIADAFLKSYAEDDVSYLTSKSEFNKKGMLSPNDISFYRTKIKSPTFVQDIVDKTGLKAEDVLDLMDERENFIELDLKPTIAGQTKIGNTIQRNKMIDQGEDWLIKNSKNYNNVEDLKKGFKRVLGKDHPFLKQTLTTSYGMPKLNPLFYEGKQKVYQTHGSPSFAYGAPEMKNLFQASLYNFNPTIRDKVLNELNDILPKTKVTDPQKYDLRKKFENSKILSDLGINKRLSGPVTRLLIKDLGENIIEDINFVKTPRLGVGAYINFLKDKVDPKYKKQFELVNKAIRQINYKNYNGAKETFGIVENINLDHRVPKYLIDAGYADEIEYIKLNPIGEKFNQVAKNKNFDQPIARLSRQYEAAVTPEEKTKIVQKMNELKDNFNKRYNNYLSDVTIKEIDNKLNVSSSLQPTTSSDEFIKALETNVKQNPELFKITNEEKNAINLLNNQFNSGLDPATINQVYSKEIGIVKNLINKVPAPIKAVGKVFGLADVALDAIFALPYLATGDIEGAKRSSTAGLLGWGKSIDEELLEMAGNKKESVQRALNNLKLVPELRDLTEEKKSLEKELANPLDEEQASIYFGNLNSVNERIKNIQDTLGKEEYTEEDEKNILDTVNKVAASKVKQAETWFGPELKQVQGPSLQQNLFNRILEEGGFSEYIPSQSIEKARGKIIPMEIPEIQSPDDSMREGFKKGGVSRRGFLGLLAGAAAAPELIKAVKGTKKASQAARVASKIQFEKAQGMYPWFPDLVEKIKTKGKPFEEKDLIMEASYKHEAKGYGGLPKGIEKLTKHVDGDTEFILREYPDGRIAVDIHSPRNQEMFETPVTLYYRPTMELKYYSGTKVEPAEFKVLEKEPRYFANGPDDVDIEMSETRKIPGKDPIYGDVEAAERFATGKIENRKIIPVKQARRDQMMDQPVDFIEETSPYGPVYD